MKKETKMVPEVGSILLDVGAALMSSGASTHRTRLTLERLASGMGFKIELLITQRALMVTVIDKDQELLFSRLKRTSPHRVNFKIVSGISRMSWKVLEGNWTLEQVAVELRRLKKLPNYPQWVELSTVGLAGSAFCHIFGGGIIEMAVTFTATFAGLFVRHLAVRKKFNPYVSVFFAALTASFIAGLAEFFNFGTNPEAAFSTAVLFLVPGVPLINSITDMMDGNIQNGLVRMVNGLIIAFAIAMGVFTIRILLNY
ncbi:MAG: threonine/serine exporter family protein [Draconibacterium sp.]|nr:threonine/serine exporter family protein [Draconibacterium sp.]